MELAVIGLGRMDLNMTTRQIISICFSAFLTFHFVI